MAEIDPVQPVPPKNPPIRDVGDCVPASVAGRRWPRWAVGVVGALAVFVILAFVLSRFAWRSHGHGWRAARVTGRILWADTREPIVGARVLTASEDDLEHGWDPETAWAEHADLQTEWEHLTSEGGDIDPWVWLGILDYGGARTGAEGHLELMVGLRATYYAGWDGGTQTAAPEEVVAALWIAPEEGAPVVVRVGNATWREARGRPPDGVWGVYELGDVLVPREEPVWQGR